MNTNFISAKAIWIIVVGSLLVTGGIAISYYLPQNRSQQNITSEGNNIYHFQKGSFIAYFPSQPIFKTDTQKLLADENSVIDNEYINNTTDNSLSVTYVSSAFNNTDTPEDNLENEVAYTSSSAGGNEGVTLISSNATTYDGFPAQDYTSSNKYGWCQTGRDILKYNDLYMVGYMYKCGSEDKSLENTFLNSITFNDGASMVSQQTNATQSDTATTTAPATSPTTTPQYSNSNTTSIQDSSAISNAIEQQTQILRQQQQQQQEYYSQQQLRQEESQQQQQEYNQQELMLQEEQNQQQYLQQYNHVPYGCTYSGETNCY